MTVEYQDYIQSGQWRAKRVRLLKKWTRGCAACGSGDTLDIHHKTYERLGAELPTDLVPLCRLCHDEIHRRHRLASSWMSLEVVTDQWIAKFSGIHERQAPKPRRDKYAGTHRGQHRKCRICATLRGRSA